MGPRSQYLETVLTCEGDFYSPDFHRQLSVFRERLQQLIFLAEDERNLILKKVEPWNSVKVTFNIPADAASRLRELAEHHDNILRDLGVLAVQIDGDRVISLSVAPSVAKETEQAVHSTSSDAAKVTTSESLKSLKLSSVEREPWKTIGTLPDSAAAAVVVTPTASVIKPNSFDGLVRPDLLASRAVHSSTGMLTLGQWPDLKAAPTVLVAARHTGPGTAFQFTHTGGALNVGLPSFTSVDANAVAAAVQLAQLKLLPPGACPNIASSSPLLVNLLQTRRQLNASSSGAAQLPVSTCFEAPGAMLPPPPKRRRSQPRKPKPPPSFNEVQFVSTGASPVGNLSTSFPFVTAESIRLAAPPTQQEAHKSQGSDEPLQRTQAESSKNDDGLSETPQMLINPYTGKMELIETADPDDQNLSSRINLNNVINSSSSFVQSLANSLSSRQMQCDDLNISTLNSNAPIIASMNSSEVEQPNNISTSSSELGVSKLSAHESCVAQQGVAPPGSVSSEQKEPPITTISDRNTCIQLPVTAVSCSVSSVGENLMPEPKLPSSQALIGSLGKAEVSGIASTSNVDSHHGLADAQRFSLNVISSLKTVLPVNHIGTVQSNEQQNIHMSIPVSASGQQIVMSCPSVPVSSVPFKPAIHLVRPGSSVATFVKLEKPESANGTAHLGVTSSTFSSATSSEVITETLNSSVSNNDIMHLAYTFAKQNGRVMSTDGPANKNCLFVNNYTSAQSSSCPSVRAPIALTFAEGSALANTLRAVTCSSMQSSTGLAASSESCFFPAVSCFPPEQRRKAENRLVAIGEPVTSGTIVPSLAGTLPAVRVSTSDIPVTPLISGNWLSSASCGSIGDFKTTTATGVTTISATLPVTFPTTNATAVMPHDIRKPLPVTAVSSSVFTFGLHNDAFHRLIPRLFPVSVVTSASSTTGIQSVHVLPRVPAPIDIDGKLRDVGVDRICGVPVSNEQNMATERINMEASGSVGMTHCASTITDLANKSRAILAGKPNKLTVVKDRRYGPSKAAEDVGLQRGSNKSHLTVAQLLEQAKNARLTLTSSEEDFSAELSTELLSATTPSSDNAAVDNSCSPSHVSMPIAEAVSKVLVDKMKKTTSSLPVISTPSGLPHCMPQSPLLPTSKPTSPVLASVPPPAVPVSVPHLPPPPPSLAHIVPVTAFAMPHQLAITSPRYPNNLTESMKRAMRGVGFYPSPPASPTAATGVLLTGSNAADSCKGAAVADCNAKTVATTLPGSENDQTDKQYVISDILNELSKSESISKFSIIKSVDRSEVIPSCTDYTDTALLEASVVSLKSPENIGNAILSSNICSLPDLIVSTTGINGCMGRSSENSSSPDQNSQAFDDAASVTVDSELKLGKSLESSASTSADAGSNSIIQAASVSDAIEISFKGSLENSLVNVRKSPITQLLSQNPDCESTVLETTSLLSNNFAADVVFPELHSKNSSTFDSLSTLEDRVLVNGSVAEATHVLEQADAWVPEAALDDGSLLNDSSSTASVGEESTTSMLAVRSSSRRGTRLVPGTSCSSHHPKTAVSTATSAVATAARRMTTRSSNRTPSSIAPSDPVTSDAISSVGLKLATRRTPSKVPEVQAYPAVDTSNATSSSSSSSQDTDSISASSRRSPRIITCSTDGRKPEHPSMASKPEPPPVASTFESSTPGVSLRSRAKVVQLMSNPKNAISLTARRVVAKDASTRQSDILLENCTHDAVSKISDNSSRCDVNGSDAIS